MPFDTLTAMSSVEWLTALSYVEGHHSLYAAACGFGKHP